MERHDLVQTVANEIREFIKAIGDDEEVPDDLPEASI